MKSEFNYNFLNKKNILVTGGTGSFGSYFVKTVLNYSNPKRLVIFSRDEFKQSELQKELANHPNNKCLRFFIGDVRNLDRLKVSCRDIEILVHAAALKQIDTAEYNPFECIDTNIKGAENVVRASISSSIKKVITISTDKAVNPINLYGASKLAADKIFISSNQSARTEDAKFSVVRYGNVIASRGSVIPYFLNISKDKKQLIHVTDKNMNRFWLSIHDAVQFVLSCIEHMIGGEIFIPKMPSIKTIDIAQALAPSNKIKFTGKRPGEKVHEVLIPEDYSGFTYENQNRYIIFPEFIDSKKITALKYKKYYKNLKKVNELFRYDSLNNSNWISKNKIKSFINDSIKKNII